MCLCIIFDLDGTLVDSETLSLQLLLDLLPELEYDIDDVLDRYRGVRLDLILADLEHRSGNRLPDDFIERYRAKEARLLEENLCPMPGALQMLRAIEFPICIASGAPLPKIRRSLHVTGVAGYFGDRLFSSYVVGRWKPDPGIFLYAAEQMGFRPSECIVVEDSAVGIEAAVAAGMHAIRYGPPGRCASVEPGTERLHDLLDLPRILQTGATTADLYRRAWGFH